MTWLVDTLIVTAALLALVLLIRRPVSRHFGPGLAYALWSLPLLRLFVPPVVLPATPAATAAETVVVSGTAAAVPVAVATPVNWLEPLALALWLAGAAGFLIWRVVSYHALRRDLLAGAHPVGRVEGIRLIESRPHQRRWPLACSTR